MPMLRSLLLWNSRREAGQSLPLFGLMIFVLLGFCAMSIDVGRLVWARTSMQAGVDAAAIAAAQDMPDWTGAQTTAATYWLENSGFIRSQGTNVQLSVTQVPGNKRIRVQGDADIGTWFAKFFGVDHWHVSASGDAEAQVLDIAVVLDISGSMCYDPPGIIHTESSENTLMSPGHASPRPMIIDQDTATAGNQGIPAGGGNSIVIRMNTVSGFSVNNRIAIHSNIGGTGSYEIFKITAISSAAKTLTVTRAQQNNWTGVWTTKIDHPYNAEVWLNRTGCANVARNTSPPYELYPFDGAISNAEYFTTLFNPSYDKIGVATYSTTASSLQSLSSDLSGVASAIHNISPPNGSTNIAHGLATGKKILDGTGKRANAVRVIVLLTDGIPNYYCTNSSAYTSNTSCSTGSSATSPTSCSPATTAMTHTWNQASAAAAADIKVFVIGLGDGVLDCVLQRTADLGGGQYYKAPTTAELDDAFKAIAEQTHIALVK
jgi:Mg-chelatase subunit ChlD